MFLIFVHPQKKELLKNEIKKIEKNLNQNQEVVEGIFILGGDGTLLRAIYEFKTPSIIFGFNYGSYGELTNFLPNELEKVIQTINTNNQFEMIKRYRLKVNDSILALNDVLITKNNHGKLNRFSIEIDGNNIGEIRCDSILIATESGSTAYNYSAHGPVINSNGFILNCINPWCLFFRPIVLDHKSRVVIKILDNLHDDAEPLVVIDGFKEIKKYSEIEITMDDVAISFASFKKKEQFFVESLKKIFHLK